MSLVIIIHFKKA